MIIEEKSKAMWVKMGHTALRRDVPSLTKANPYKLPRELGNHLFTHVTSYTLRMTGKLSVGM